MMDMASNKHLTSWKVLLSAKGVAITTLFRVCNDKALVPTHPIDNFASLSLRSNDEKLSLPRADFLLCIRASKIAEQMAVSRSRLCVGPLMTTLSNAVIMECTPSWRIVLYSLGIVTSLDSSECFIKQLITEREQATKGEFV